MAESSVPVDLLNPGQVFACLGILEMSDVLLGHAAAAFDWRDEQETTFLVVAAGEEPPVERVMRFLEEARIVTRIPAHSASAAKWLAKWGDAPIQDALGGPFPFPDPGKPDRLPVVLRDDAGNEIAIDYWGDATRRDDVKFWAGAGGYPGAALLRDAMRLVSGKLRQSRRDPFQLSAEQTSSFRFDWRRDYVPAQDGFSSNQQNKSGAGSHCHGRIPDRRNSCGDRDDECPSPQGTQARISIRRAWQWPQPWQRPHAGPCLPPGSSRGRGVPHSRTPLSPFRHAPGLAGTGGSGPVHHAGHRRGVANDH